MKTTWPIQLCLLLLPVAAAQAQFTYTTNNGTVTIASYTGSGGAVTIPSSVDGLPVTGIAGYAISDLFSTAITVTIPATVTNIGDYAFEFDYDLDSVYFEGNAPTVGSHVFIDDNLFGGTHTAYYLAGAAGWGSTIGDNVATKPLTEIAITANPTNGLEPLAVSFTAAGIDSASNAVSNWNWNFGDGSTISSQNPSHNYTNSGTFTVVLIETNSNGFPSAGSAVSITVNPFIVAFTANPTNGYVPLTVNFTSGGVDNDGNSLTNWTWTFGDGTTSTAQNPSHTYTTSGTFPVTLYATNNIGATVLGSGPASIHTVPAPVANFTFTNDNGSLVVTGYSGSGGTVIIPSATNGLPVTSVAGYAFSDETTITRLVIPGSVTNLGNYAFELCSGLTSVFFEGNAPVAPFQTFFADSATAYYLSGTTGWDSFSPLTSVKELPAIAITAAPSNGVVPLMVGFTAADVDSASNGVGNWNWAFGDGSTRAAQNPSHTYTTNGAFTAALFETDGLGGLIAGSAVSVTAYPLTVAFTADPINGTVPFTVSFTSAAVDNGGNTISNWNWSFGDGATSTAQNPTHQYTTGGNFSLTLIGTNNDGLPVVGSGPPSISALWPVPQATNFTVLHTFAGGDGANPMSGPILSGNSLFGTTLTSTSPVNGTVFSLNDATTNFADLLFFSVLNFPRDFENYDGAHPVGRLIQSGNTLYGTASLGGQAGYGNVFSFNPATLTLTALHYFSTPGTNSLGLQVNSDGIGPRAALILAGNTLYGTAQFGGSNGCGTAFSLDLVTSNFTTLYAFTGGADGASPLGDLIVSGNTLYGTANQGGNNGFGTIFSVNTNGSNFTSLFSFTGGADGANPPRGGLLLWSSNLYGTTEYGGSNGFGTNGFGTIFSVNTNGSNFVSLYSFTGGADGAYPAAGLIVLSNTLYGVASGGGAGGEGTIFGLTPGSDGSNFTTLHSFASLNGGSANVDGANPQPGLILLGNTLYGAAESGGTNGDGTVFVLPLPGSAVSTVSIPLGIQLSGGSVVLSWNDPASAFSLQSATGLTGVFTNIPGAVPPYTNLITGAQQFFRLVANPP